MDKPDQASRLLLLQLDATVAAAALCEFLAALIEASQNLEANRRQGWLDALEAVYRLLDTLDPQDADRTKVPIATLMTALQDLELGKVDPGLAHTRRPKGGQLSGYDQVVTRALAAAATNLLYDAGRSKPEAALIVARALYKLRVPVGNQRTDTIKGAGKTIEKWRERLSLGLDQQIAIERYSSFKEIIRFPPGTSVDGIETGLSKLLSEALAGRIKKINAVAKPVEDSGASHDSPDALVVGAVVDGHRYIGGDPDEESSWEAVR